MILTYHRSVHSSSDQFNNPKLFVKLRLLTYRAWVYIGVFLKVFTLIAYDYVNIFPIFHLLPFCILYFSICYLSFSVYTGMPLHATRPYVYCFRYNCSTVFLYIEFLNRIVFIKRHWNRLFLLYCRVFRAVTIFLEAFRLCSDFTRIFASHMSFGVFVVSRK